MADPDLVTRLLTVQQQAAALGATLSDVIATRLGIAATDLKCLFLLVQGPHTPRELAKELRMSPSAITSVVDRLEKAGFAHREQSKSDRRQVVVSVVPERAQSATDLYLPLFTRMSEVLTQYDLEQLATLHHFAEQSVTVLRAEIERLGR